MRNGFKQITTKAALSLFLAASLAFPASQPRHICGSHALKAEEELALHERWQATAKQGLLRAYNSAEPKAAAPRDIGDLVIMDDSDGVISRRNIFNLAQRTVRFQPTVEGAAKYRFDTTDVSYDPALATAGTAVPLGDDDSRLMTLPFSFPYFGKSHRNIYINSDGNLSFEEGDNSTADRSIARAAAGPPRIMGLYNDLDPSRTPTGVRFLAESNRVAISWIAVPEYSSFGSGSPQTFQIRLYPDGRLEIAFDTINALSAVVGIAPGRLQPPTSLVVLKDGSSQEFTGAVMERFTNIEEVDVVSAAQKFYEKHGDNYDYLVFYNNVGIAADVGAIAYELTVRSLRLGTGQLPIEFGQEFGSSRRLQGVMNMGPLNQYPRDPDAVVPSRFLSRDTPLTILGHETGHLFLAFVSLFDPVTGAPSMIGRDGAHWAFTFNSEASLLEGNRIEDLGDGASPRFRTVATVEGYSPLDQYLMGFRPPWEVPPTFAVTQATVGPPERQPQTGVTFNGTRNEVTVDALAALYGPRRPDHTAAQRRFRMAFVLITSAGVDPQPAELEQLDNYRRRFEGYYHQASGQRAFLDTRLARNLDLSLWPAGGVALEGTATARVSIDQPAEANLTILLRTETGAAGAPASVTIPAGQRSAEFTVRGVRAGPDDIIAEPADNRYATAHARIAVRPTTEIAPAVRSGNRQRVMGSTGIAGRPPLPLPIVITVIDQNFVPYAGREVRAEVTAGGSVEPAVALTGPDGNASFRWIPGPGPVHELKATLSNGASTIATALDRPFVSQNGVVNGASFVPGVVSGGFGTIFGASLAAGRLGQGRSPYSDSLAGVRVSIAGRPARLVFVSDRQINFLAPAGLPLGEADVVVTTPDGETSTPVKTTVFRLQPGIFQDSAGNGAIISQPTHLEIYSTGLGAVTPSSQSLLLEETVVKPVVTIGGQTVEVLFSGLAPGFLGLYQVNVRRPAGLAGDQPVVIDMEGARSNTVRVRLP
jgi:uncharacterized protein (TIGR03437 family)